MISVEEARARILRRLAPVSGESVALPQALGRVLAADVAARLTHPPTDVSAMDGYAVRAADLGQGALSLALIGESAAGHPFAGTVGPGQAVRIFTGAALPAGADAVVMQEDTSRDGERVTIAKAVAAGTFIRCAGLDFATGRVLLRAGKLLTARDIALAAAMNVPWLSVRRRPRVAILSTGDELVMPGEPMDEGQIVGSNGPGLAAFVTAHGGEPVQLGIAADSREALEALVAGAVGCDLLVTSGGASVGEYDLVKDALGEAGLMMDFHKIAMRPGKPLMSGRLGTVPMLGLPGNPVSAMVCAELFLGSMLRALLGLPSALPASRATLGRDLPGNDRRQDYLRARLEPGSDFLPVAIPFDCQDSAVLSVLAQADCLVVRPPLAPPAKSGDVVDLIPLSNGLF